MSYDIRLLLQVFDFGNLEWLNIKLKPNADKLDDSDSQEALSPISGHNMVRTHSQSSYIFALVCFHILLSCMLKMVCTFQKILRQFFYFWQIKWGNKLLLLGGLSKKLSNEVIGSLR